jgi:hypothetical protein
LPINALRLILVTPVDAFIAAPSQFFR